MDKIKILQLGNSNWNNMYHVPINVEIQYESFDEITSKTLFDAVFIDRELSSKEISIIRKTIRSYTLFVLDDVEMNEEMQVLFSCKKGKFLSRLEVQNFFDWEIRNYFSKPYGEKFRLGNISIAQNFSGNVKWLGNYCINIEGEFGDELNQIVFWRNNIPVFKGQAIDFWLEYEKDESVEISLSIKQFVQGTLSSIQQEWEFSETELSNVVTIDNQMESGLVFVSLRAKGKGKLKIVALHDRYSRRGHGIFLPGGERYVTSSREEIFAYFDPGDMKPPLNVYFSGYKTMQGFEGYYMMRKMGAPFLLIGEPRLEGGAFYMGAEEYETLLANIIQKYMKELGFSNNQVILSGLSMGTYGALYYGCDIKPHAMILGKPLASIGDVAVNERLHRPGGFATSLDVLGFTCGEVNQEAARRLNARFWDKFDRVDWSNSKFIVSYMIEDDYDMTAYETLLSHVQNEGVQVYGKGIHGRHNDNSVAINRWFVGQYHKILEEDFGRGL